MNITKAQQNYPGGQILQIVLGDITEETTDTIVNAANSQLMHGGGVAGVISRKGGPIIQQESNDWVKRHGPVTHSEPAFTGAGQLPSHYVIHAVGPIWGEGNEDRKLSDAVNGCLRLAEILQLTSLALPAISTGIFGFPIERAALDILSAINHYYVQNPASNIVCVRLVLFDEHAAQIFMLAMSYTATG